MNNLTLDVYELSKESTITFNCFLIPLFTPLFSTKTSHASTMGKVPKATAENVLCFFNAGDFEEDP